MEGFSKNILLAALLALLPTGVIAATPRTVVYLSGHNYGDGDGPGNDYVTIWRDGPLADEDDNLQPLVGKPLRHFIDGRATGTVHITALESDDNSMCGNARHLRLAEPALVEGAQLLSSGDLNPAGRFARRAARGEEQRQILHLAQTDTALLHALPRATLAQALSAFSTDAQDRSALHVITDAGNPQHRLALLLVSHGEPPASDDGSYLMTQALALFESDGEQWQRRAATASHGCEDCDNAPNGYTLLDWGDIDGDGLPDLLLQSTGYETYGYHLMLSSRQWALLDIPGGC